MAFLRHLPVLLLSAALAVPSSIACDHCIESKRELPSLERAIERMLTIIRMNEEFIATLSPDDESERIKANSNISIARKRLVVAEREADARRTVLQTPFCKNCMRSE
jgi:hypothetical protein